MHQIVSHNYAVGSTNLDPKVLIASKRKEKKRKEKEKKNGLLKDRKNGTKRDKKCEVWRG